MKLKITILLFFIATFVGFSQKLNGYKYVIIPKKYDFQKIENKYRLNSLTKFLFEKEGFKALYSDGKLPEDLYKNPCLALEANVVESSNMFTTKLTLELVSKCEKATVFTSKEGKSKEKDYQKAHHEALRNAFKSIKAIDYKFDNTKVIKETNTTYVSEDEIPITTDLDNLVVYEGEDIVEEDRPNNNILSDINVLYAQNIPNGFQLVDSTPKIVFKALKSNTEDLYYLEGQAGVLTKENDKWFAEYYKNGKLIKEELNIKF